MTIGRRSWKRYTWGFLLVNFLSLLFISPYRYACRLISEILCLRKLNGSHALAPSQTFEDILVECGCWRMQWQRKRTRLKKIVSNDCYHYHSCYLTDLATSDSTFKPLDEVLEPFHQFIIRFLSCEWCAKNFRKEVVSHKLNEVSTRGSFFFIEVPYKGKTLSFP